VRSLPLGSFLPPPGMAVPLPSFPLGSAMVETEDGRKVGVAAERMARLLTLCVSVVVEGVFEVILAYVVVFRRGRGGAAHKLLTGAPLSC